jgi:hypothetical protein
MESWAVKKPDGEEVGQIKKLIIDGKTRQIAYAGVLLLQSKRVAILPWSLFEVANDAITVHATDAELQAARPLRQPVSADPVPAVEIAATVLGKIRAHPRRRARL